MRVILLFFLLLSVSWGQEPKLTRTYPVNSGDFTEVKKSIEALLSPQGKVIALEPQRKLIVQDIPSSLSLIDSVMQEVNAPKPNVRIDVTLQEFGDEIQRQFTVEGRTKIGGIDVGNREDRGGRVTLKNQNGGNDSLNAQFLVVQSGGSAAIQIGEEVPFVDYFWSYANGLGLVTGVPHWQKIGSQLRIRPMVVGELITVELLPEITSLVETNPETVQFRKLATTVTIANGGSMVIGGFDNATEEFNRSFFNRGKNKNTRVGNITLKANIQ